MSYVSDINELPASDTLMKISGLEFMQQVLTGELPNPPMGRTMGYALHAVEDGRVVFRGIPTFDVTNTMRGVHGGWYGTLLDSAMACAVMTRVPRGSTYTTLEYKINVIRPVPLGVETDCIGTVDHAGRLTAVAHGEVRGVSDNRLYATGTTTCIIMDMSKR